MVFRPYTRVRRAICTSATLRTSTGISSGFILRGHRSLPFGYLEAHSAAVPHSLGPGRAAAIKFPLEENSIAWHVSLSLRLGELKIFPSGSRDPRTPWSVFQDGRLSFRLTRVGRGSSGRSPFPPALYISSKGRNTKGGGKGLAEISFHRISPFLRSTRLEEKREGRSPLPLLFPADRPGDAPAAWNGNTGKGGGH